MKAAELQAMERERRAKAVRAVASRDGLTACMNNTKWSRICFAFDSLPSHPRFRICDLQIDGQPEMITEWMHDFPHGMLPFITIRWLEVELPASEVDDTIAMCRRNGVTASTSPAGIRIYGWVGGEESASDGKTQ